MEKRSIALAEGWASIIINILLFAVKLAAGIMSGSIAVVADAWHTLSDSFTSIIVLVGTKVSGKPADHEHPFGHGRFELIAAIIIGVLLAVTGFNFLTEAIEKLSENTSAEFPPFVMIVIAASAIIKEITARFAYWCYKKTGLQALKADGAHHRSDALSSLVIFIGIIAGRSFWWSDSVLAILISLFIFYTSWEVLREGIDPLLGEIPDNKLEKEIISIADKVCDCYEHIHHMHIHKYGNHAELTFHIRFDPEMSIKDGHAETTKLEKAILDELGIHATIHLEPDERQACN